MSEGDGIVVGHDRLHVRLLLPVGAGVEGSHKPALDDASQLPGRELERFLFIVIKFINRFIRGVGRCLREFERGREGNDEMIRERYMYMYREC